MASSAGTLFRWDVKIEIMKNDYPEGVVGDLPHEKLSFKLGQFYDVKTLQEFRKKISQLMFFDIDDTVRVGDSELETMLSTERKQIRLRELDPGFSLPQVFIRRLGIIMGYEVRFGPAYNLFFTAFDPKQSYEFRGISEGALINYVNPPTR